MKVGLLKETKTPPDRRVPIDPAGAEDTLKKFPGIELFVQASDLRCFADSEYSDFGLNVVDDVSSCDILLGVKEVHIPDLIPGKTYLFFILSTDSLTIHLKLMARLARMLRQRKLVDELKAAKTAGVSLDKAMFDGAINWFDRATNTAGKCGYMRPGDDGSVIRGVNEHFAKLPTMTGVSVICRIFCGQSRRDPKVLKGVDILMANLPNWNKPKNDRVDMYYWYYATYAMFQYGGQNWHKWNTAMKKALLDTQRVGGCADGSWDPVGKWGMVGGRVYATAINCLTLEIYYRYARAHPGEHMTRDMWQGK